MVKIIRPRRYVKRYQPYTRRPKRAALITRPVNIGRSLASPAGVFGFPTSLRTKLRYHESIAYVSAAGSVTQNIFRFNSLFDPNETGLGHQPHYFDQLSAVYGRYVVVASTIKATFMPVTETAATACWKFGIVGQSGGTISASADINCELGHSVWDQINGRTGGPNQKTLMLSYTPGACLNLTTKDTDAGALVSANPDQTYKAVVWTADLQATGNTNMIVNIEFVYDVVFTDRVFVASS